MVSNDQQTVHKLSGAVQSLEDHKNDPPVLHPTWALRQHRQWWAHREFSFPIFFGVAYVLFLVWSVTQLFG